MYVNGFYAGGYGLRLNRPYGNVDATASFAGYPPILSQRERGVFALVAATAAVFAVG